MLNVQDTCTYSHITESANGMKMKSSTLIEQIYYSQRHTYCNFKESKATKRALKKFNEIELLFTEIIKTDENLYRLYCELEDLQTEYLSNSTADAFYYGFKRGAQMILEVTADKFTGDID